MRDEKQLLREAIKTLNNLTGSKIKELPLSPGDREIDARISITFAGTEHHFKVEAKGEIRQSSVLHIVERFGKNKDQWLLIARYIPQPLKDHFRSLGLNYLELAGNCYINVKGIFIYIADQKVTPVREKTNGKLWKPTGIKFIFALIDNPPLLQRSYRDIAMAAGIALGNIGPLLAELKEAGYTKQTEKGEELTHKEKLIIRWTELYYAILRPRLLQGQFRFLRPENANHWKDKIRDGVFWGGEPGGALLTKYLQPEHFTIYSEKSGNELIKTLSIVPDKSGNITLLKKFWGNPGSGYIDNAAPPLLVYADLINDLDSRNHETAERIKEAYLQ